LQINKPALLHLLAVESPSPPLPHGESVESPAVERQAAAAGGESHGAPASPSHSLCSHPMAYRRPSGVAVCLDCAATLAPGAPEWQPQTIIYCEPGHHVWFPRCEGDGDMLQCQKCPQVTPAATTPPYRGTVQALDHRPVQAAQTALPLGSDLPHGEVLPQRRARR
jgi:hypothetical protein